MSIKHKKNMTLTVQPHRFDVFVTCHMISKAKILQLHLVQEQNQWKIQKVEMIRPQIAGEFHPEPTGIQKFIQY